MMQKGDIIILIALAGIFGVGMAKYKNIMQMLDKKHLMDDGVKPQPGGVKTGTGYLSGYDARHPMSPTHTSLEIVEISEHTPVTMNPSIY
jgi:hypothetical protein